MPTLTLEAWAQIRTAYEHSDRPVADICAEYGISTGTLRDRMRRWDWTRRQVPIPREGPPALIVPVAAMLAPRPPLPACGERAAAEAERRRSSEGALPNSECDENPPPPISSPSRDEDAREHAYGSKIDLSPQAGSGNEAAGPRVLSAANADTNPATIGPRLQGAIARVLPAIDAALATLAAGPLRPREMEQTARALGTLTRTLRELTAALREHPPGARADDDPVPEDVDEMRYELTRRIHAFIAAHEAEQAEEETTAEGAEGAADVRA